VRNPEVVSSTGTGSRVTGCAVVQWVNCLCSDCLEDADQRGRGIVESPSPEDRSLSGCTNWPVGWRKAESGPCLDHDARLDPPLAVNLRN